jgi:ketosteroid isomerase-like protein
LERIALWNAMRSGESIVKPKLVYFMICTILTYGLIACTSVPVADPEETVQGFYQAMNDGDMETAMSFVADDIECRGHCYITGKDAFRTFIQTNLDHRDQFEISDLVVQGEEATFDYVIHRGNSVLARGVDSVMRVQDGKIVYFEMN